MKYKTIILTFYIIICIFTYMKEVKMEQIRDLPHIRAVLMEKAKALRELSNQAFHLENQIRKIAGSIYNAEEGVPKRKNQGASGQD